MYKVLILLLATALFSYKGLKTCSGDSKLLRGYHITYKVPVVYQDTSVSDLDSYYDVFYYKDLIAYRASYMFDSIVNGILLKQAERSFYLIYHKDSLYGQTFYPESSRGMRHGRLKVDSVKRKLAFESSVYDSFSTAKPDSVYSNAERELVKVYTILPTESFPEKYTYYFYYTQSLGPLKETFSKKMDAVKNMKLFKIRMIAHGGYWQQYKVTFPARELLLEIKAMATDNKEEILGYFKKYEQKNFED